MLSPTVYLRQYSTCRHRCNTAIKFNKICITCHKVSSGCSFDDRKSTREYIQSNPLWIEDHRILYYSECALFEQQLANIRLILKFDTASCLTFQKGGLGAQPPRPRTVFSVFSSWNKIYDGKIISCLRTRTVTENLVRFWNSIPFKGINSAT